jgi:imidazoleglycerol-phosphate dehydratase
MERNAEIYRKTNETAINLSFTVDGSGKCLIETGIGFFDHMLNIFGKHGLYNILLKADGDLNVDMHHTIEDIGIVLGEAFNKALGNKKSIKRYGSFILPMDEALAMVAVDIGGRAFLSYDVQFTSGKVGDVDTELFEEFFRAFATNAAINLHIKVLYGSNNHHIIEAVFKAFARALDAAVMLDSRIDGIMSTKGTL